MSENTAQLQALLEALGWEIPLPSVNRQTTAETVNDRNGTDSYEPPSDDSLSSLSSLSESDHNPQTFVPCPSQHGPNPLLTILNHNDIDATHLEHLVPIVMAEDDLGRLWEQLQEETKIFWKTTAVDPKDYPLEMIWGISGPPTRQYVGSKETITSNVRRKLTCYWAVLNSTHRVWLPVEYLKQDPALAWCMSTYNRLHRYSFKSVDMVVTRDNMPESDILTMGIEYAPDAKNSSSTSQSTSQNTTPPESLMNTTCFSSDFGVINPIPPAHIEAQRQVALTLVDEEWM
jgi:hypothetical protein